MVEGGADLPATAVKDAIRAKALDLGFADIGFAAARSNLEWRRDLDAWLKAGCHGDMAWMEANADRRADLKALWPEAKTAVVLATSYAPADDPLADLARPELGNVSVYARGRDYHDVVKKRLKQLARWMADQYGAEVKVFVDTAPVMEKPLAAQTRLGWQGRHTNLVSRSLGSWFFLSEVLTTLDLPPDSAESDHCGKCRACEDNCPTGAIVGPRRLDPERCISYLTIEHKGQIPVELRPLMGNRIYGCDDCLAACPWNKFAQAADAPEFLARAELTAPLLAELASLDDANFRKLFAGSPVKRTGRDRFVRNVLIAIGNSGAANLLQTAENLAEDASPLVRGMAAWAIRRLGDETKIAAWKRRRSVEQDEDVRKEWL